MAESKSERFTNIATEVLPGILDFFQSFKKSNKDEKPTVKIQIDQLSLTQIIYKCTDCSLDPNGEIKLEFENPEKTSISLIYLRKKEDHLLANISWKSKTMVWSLNDLSVDVLSSASTGPLETRRIGLTLDGKLNNETDFYRATMSINGQLKFSGANGKINFQSF